MTWRSKKQKVVALSSTERDTKRTDGNPMAKEADE